MNENAKKAAEQTQCDWEAGRLGDSIQHAVRATDEHASQVDDALALQMISIRLPRALISDLKLIAEKEGLGYQPLIRRVLTRFSQAEFRNMAHEILAPGVDTCHSSPVNDPHCSHDEPRYAVG